MVKFVSKFSFKSVIVETIQILTGIGKGDKRNETKVRVCRCSFLKLQQGAAVINVVKV
jgi:hypothetical protein